MPFYEYQCSQCAHSFEALQKISDAPLKKCPSCGRNTLKKLVSAPVFRLKGSGWYETDFKSDQERKRNLAGAEGPSGDGSAGAENKPKSEADSTVKADAKPQAPGGGESAPAKAAEAGSASRGSAKPTAASPASRRASRAGVASGTGSSRTARANPQPAKRAGVAPRARASSARARPTRKRR
ncbi:MAG TPA: zinc ribbon domain-containing protein [Steroidobacteraceae bacterium]|jgi:putative FmdB family regulatory protein